MVGGMATAQIRARDREPRLIPPSFPHSAATTHSLVLAIARHRHKSSLLFSLGAHIFVLWYAICWPGINTQHHAGPFTLTSLTCRVFSLSACYVFSEIRQLQGPSAFFSTSFSLTPRIQSELSGGKQPCWMLYLLGICCMGYACAAFGFDPPRIIIKGMMESPPTPQATCSARLITLLSLSRFFRLRCHRVHYAQQISQLSLQGQCVNAVQPCNH
jgi:hypothetical protein